MGRRLVGGAFRVVLDGHVVGGVNLHFLEYDDRRAVLLPAGVRTRPGAGHTGGPAGHRLRVPRARDPAGLRAGRRRERRLPGRGAASRVRLRGRRAPLGGVPGRPPLRLARLRDAAGRPGGDPARHRDRRRLPHRRSDGGHRGPGPLPRRPRPGGVPRRLPRVDARAGARRGPGQHHVGRHGVRRRRRPAPGRAHRRARRAVGAPAAAGAPGSRPRHPGRPRPDGRGGGVGPRVRAVRREGQPTGPGPVRAARARGRRRGRRRARDAAGHRPARP